MILTEVPLPSSEHLQHRSDKTQQGDVGALSQVYDPSKSKQDIGYLEKFQLLLVRSGSSVTKTYNGKIIQLQKKSTPNCVEHRESTYRYGVGIYKLLSEKGVSSMRSHDRPVHPKILHSPNESVGENMN